MSRLFKRGILLFFCAALALICVSCSQAGSGASSSASGAISSDAAINTARPAATDSPLTTVQPAVSPSSDGQDFNTLPAQDISGVYGRCIIVRADRARQYEMQAAQLFYEFISRDIKADIVDSDGFSNDTGGELPALIVYIGETGLEEPESVWVEFNKNGYIMEGKDNCLVFRGSSAENTYTAVSRYIFEIMDNNTANISTWDMSSGVSGQFPAVSREEYILDINKFETVWQYEWQPPEWILDFEGKLKDFTNTEARPMCYAHRGDIESYPENSIEAVISAVKKGADMIELDVCMTRDKVLVLMHGEDLSVTTDWALKRGETLNGIKLPMSSSISAWTYEQLCQLRLRTGNGEYSAADSEITEYIIPTLKEAFMVCNERSLLVLDRVTTSHWDKIYEIIKETKAYRCFTYSAMATSADQAYYYRTIVLSECGQSAPTCFSRGPRWTGCGRIDHYYEFSLTTDEEFDEYFKEETKYGCFVLTNRVSKLIDFINRHYAP